MNDLSSFKAPYITPARIHTVADRFRQQYNPTAQLPLDIQAIIEFDLGIRIRTIHNMQVDCDIDALLLGDLQTIAVDHRLYMDSRFENRLRFSLAHEIGHKILHPNLYGDITHATPQEWIASFQSIPEDQYSWIEQHAYEFAGRLLVPVDRLQSELASAVKLATAAGFTAWDTSGDAALSYVAVSIARVFGVSSDVIVRRLTRENLWPPTVTPSARPRP